MFARLFVLFVGCVTAWAALAEPARVEFFNPSGTVKAVRQVTARFTEQMAAFGDPRLVDPFDVQCPAKGKGRWADGKNWVYDFEQDLPAGIECSFKLKPDLRTLAGAAVAPEEFRFDTGGPQIRASLPREGHDAIDEEQIFYLVLDAPAQPETIEANAHCVVSGVGETIGVRLIVGKERDKLLRQRAALGSSLYRLLLIGKPQAEIGGLSERALFAGSTQGKITKLKLSQEDQARLAIVQCRQRFPNDADVRLVWGAGISAFSGIAAAQEQTLAFHSRKDFTARFSCDRINAAAGCVPILPMYLGFSAPVSAKQLARIKLVDANGRSYRAAKTPKNERPAEFADSVTFTGPFPEQTRFTLSVPADLRDDAGRSLANAGSFPLTTRSDAYPPLAKFPAHFGILEAKAGGVLPVTLRNLEARVKGAQLAMPAIAGRVQRLADAQEADLVTWLARVEEAAVRGRDQGKGQGYERPGSFSVFEGLGQSQPIVLPKPNGRKAFEVVGIPLKKPGFYVVELASPRLGQALHGTDRPFYVSSASLVTNLAAHFKHGRESSLVWVTTLDRGAPVRDALVSVRLCNGRVLWQGRTDRDGIARIAAELGEPPYNLCPGWNGGYLVTARSRDDMTFVLSSWDQGIEPWNFKVDFSRGAARAWAAHSVLDRTLLRAGDTVHMKHFFRKRSGKGFEAVGTSGYPSRLTVTHLGSDQKYEFDLDWDEKGSAATTWSIPKDAKLGVYNLRLGSWDAGQLRVEEYRIPSMKAAVQAPRAPLVGAAEAKVDVQVSFLAGGGAGYAPVKLRSSVQPKSVYFEDYGDFTFANGDVKEGLERRGNLFEDFFYEGAAAEAEEDGQEPAAERGAKPLVSTQQLTLDEGGAARALVGGLPKSALPQELRLEVEFNDPNGETLTASSSATLWPAQHLVGIEPDAWVASKDQLKFRLLVLDLAGKPVAGAAVEADLFVRANYSHRKRLIGGFYAYEHVVETKRIGRACAGRSDARGYLHCSLKPPQGGNLIIRARTVDDVGQASVANRDVWVAGAEDWWFTPADNDRMDVLPEKKRYQPGERARLQVRMPFRSATALVTVEREGILESFVTHLSGKQPFIELPLTGHYAPNVYVSVLALRGRVEGVKPTATVDLGKPAFKLGVTELQVGWQAHQLKVKVAADKPLYKVREKAQVKVHVSRADGGPLPKGSEVALAAVDQGLLELLPNHSWKLLEAMMTKRPMEVATATAQLQVVGKRHYGRKALPHGGGGGKQPTRELFDTLLYWNPHVLLDENGDASVEVPLNDSLSAFRIVAVASSGVGLFGTGDTEIRASQDLMLYGGLPPQVRDSDRFSAGFTVRNASERELEVELGASIQAEGKRLAAGAKPHTLPTQRVKLAPGAAQEVSWDVSVPPLAETLRWEVSARELEGAAFDRLKLAQRVVATYPVRVYQGTILQLERPLSMNVQKPADALPERGGVRITLTPKLSDSLSGVQDYMFFYPYTCIEQRTSIAVALRDPKLWEHTAGLLPSYLDGDGLVKYFPMMIQGDDTLTAYLLAVVQEAGWKIPDATRERMLQGLAGFVEGRVVRYSALPTADLAIRKMAAVEALSRYGRATPQLLQSISIEPNLWPTSAVLDWMNVLKRVEAIPDRAGQLKQADAIIRARLNFQGTSMGFSTERSDALWWLMISGDSNAARSVLTLVDDTAWKEDMPRLVRGAVARQRKGHWNTTTANAWGVLALEKFSAKFESVPVSGTTEARLGGAVQQHAWAKQAKGGTLQFDWPRQSKPSAEQLQVRQQGSGKPWVTLESLAALPLQQPFSSGYRIARQVTPVQQKQPGVWSRGDVMRVRLEIDAQADMTWVVVDDPIPSGASILGSGLGRDSQLLSASAQPGWIAAAYQERTFEAYRAYYAYVPKGKFSLEYTLRLNNPGQFDLPATHVEAMYAPEMLGELPNASVTVGP